MGGNENDFDGWDLTAWSDPNGAANPNGNQVQGQDILTNSTVTEGQDKWTGFFQGILSNVTQYAINRDAARNNLRPVTLPNGQPNYGPNGQATSQAGGVRYVQGVSNQTAIIIGAAIVGVLLVAGGKKA